MTKGSSGKVLMVQGTASHVGKSVMVAALCHIFRQDGYRVAPFKAQNMSNNSYVTPDGREIGRAQVVQAEASGIEPRVEMNPILLKPESDNRSQVVVMGKPLESLPAQEYYSRREQLWTAVTESLDKLMAEYEVVVIEGAGSPAEVNLHDRDIVNMRVALYCQAPVMLVADIDRGGVFASIVGTLELLEHEERAIVKAVAINKFRGDLSLLTSGLDWLEKRTGVPVAGVIPYYRDIHIAEEDSVSLERRRIMKSRTDYVIDVAVMGLPHISNFDEFDSIEREPGVRLRYVEAGDALGSPDLIIIPGTKSTMADLQWLQSMGFSDRIVELHRKGVPVIGICGGYQMLGQRISDPAGVESDRQEITGLGLLPVTTLFEGSKDTHQVVGEVSDAPGLLEGACGLPVRGYEIHMGQSFYAEEQGTRSEAHIPEAAAPDGQAGRPFYIQHRSGQPWDRPDGVIDSSGRVLGTYIHGLFHNTELRRAILERLAQWKGVSLPEGIASLTGDGEYDKLADLVRGNLNMKIVYEMTGLAVPEELGNLDSIDLS